MNYDDSDVNDLMRSSMEVSSALDVFMRERENAARNQETALKAYESEMLNILAESRPDSLEESDANKIVDHTLLRHIGAEGDYRHENRGSMEENVSAMSMPRSGSDSYVSSDGDLSVRRREPTPEERIALREEMFSFFETSRQTENSMVDALDRALNSESSEQSPDILDDLYHIQSRNFGLLMNYLDEYQPRPFMKAWGNDPEYIALGKKYGIKSKEGAKVRTTFATFKHAHRIKRAASTKIT